jgi:protein phosphatase
VLSRRERRRRRREDRRERRAWNKWVSFRGVLFLLAFAAVIVGAYVVLRWYGTANYIVTVRSDKVVVLQGRLGGFLWWSPRVVSTQAFGPLQLPISARAQLTPGLDQPTLADALRFITNMHALWAHVHGHGSTSTTTTTLAGLPTGGT